MEEKSYVFDHKLSEEEIEELLENFDYDTWLAEFDEDAEPEPNESYERHSCRHVRGQARSRCMDDS